MAKKNTPKFDVIEGYPSGEHARDVANGEPANGAAEPVLLKLDLGCGDNVRQDPETKEYFTGVDLYATNEHVKYKLDLMKFPWEPFGDASVGEAWCSHFFEHIPGPVRVQFMDECYRILAPGAKLTIIVPYWSSMRSIQDPFHAWPPVAESSFLYFNKSWREANKLTHYLGVSDFDFNYGYMLDQETANKAQEVQYHYIKHYIQAVNDLQVNLTRRPASGGAAEA